MYSWLLTPVHSYIEIITICIYALFINIIWATASAIILTIRKSKVLPNIQQDTELAVRQFTAKPKAALLVFFLHALGEEVVFRFIPIVLTGYMTTNMQILICVCILSSLIFGFVHGGNLIKTIVIGGSGFVYSIVFLKLGGADKDALVALLSISLIHLTYNMIIIFLSKLSMKLQAQMRY